MNKTFTWTNKFFKIEFYSLGILSVQLALFIGLAATWLFSREDATKKLCVVFLLIDIVANLIVLITSSEFSTDSDEEVSSDEITTTVEHSTEKDKPKQKEVAKPSKGRGRSSNTINNKVPVPNPQPAKSVPKAPAPAPAPAPAEEPPLKKPTSISFDSGETAKPVKSVAEMSDEDWADLWKT